MVLAEALQPQVDMIDIVRRRRKGQLFQVWTPARLLDLSISDSEHEISGGLPVGII